MGSAFFSRFILVTAVTLTSPWVAADSPYEIGPGDVLQVAVLGQPTFTGEFSVDANGMMNYPFVGKVKASGLSPSDVERKLVTLLSEGYLKQPQVSVSIKQYRSKRVYVTGEVARPGPYGLRPNRMLSALLDDIGGLSPNAGHEVVVVRPPSPGGDSSDTSAAGSPGPTLPGEVEGSQVFHVNVRELRSGYADRDIQLQVGDTVYFPKAAHIYVTGQVARPGTFPYEEGLTVFQVLNMAGGVTERGSEKGVRIIRLVDGKKKSVKPELTDLLQPDDTINVPERFF